MDAGVNLSMISIGKAEVGKELISNLGIDDGDEFLYADTDNSLYDALELNTGIKGMINPATAFSFRDRIFNGEMGEILEVMGKWKESIYIPPKGSQAFNQGGVFVLDHSNKKTLFAHYDESVGAHADIDIVIKTATDAAVSSKR